MTPITDKTFERQGWIKLDYSDDEYDFDEEYPDDSDIKEYYWILPLPKDNPDPECPVLVSSPNTEWPQLNINSGEYLIEIDNFFSLGVCKTEEELQNLYYSLTKCNIED